MKCALLLVLLAAAASAVVVSNDVPDVEEMLHMDDEDMMTDVDVNEMQEVIVTDEDELIDEAGEPAQTAVATRRNLIVGTITPGDRVAYSTEVRANGVAGHIHVRNIRIHISLRATAVQLNEVGDSQNATLSIIGGGIGSSFVTIRIRSAVGRGYHYRIRVFVR